MAAIRYRSGYDETTGKIISGPAHLAQSLRTIWRTRLTEVFMLLDFGSDIRGLLAEDVTPELALMLYNEMVGAASLWEPEFEVSTLQLVIFNEFGTLGVRYGGTYYPEGRFGNYEAAIPLSVQNMTIAEAA